MTVKPDSQALPKKRGRPASGKALTGAERIKAHRAKKAEELKAAIHEYSGLSSPEAILNELRSYFLVTETGKPRAANTEQAAKEAWLALGERMGWL